MSAAMASQVAGCSLEVAVHEAGHAVVAAYLRCPFTHVTILPGVRGEGYVRFKSSGVREFALSRKTDSFGEPTLHVRRRTAEEIKAELNRRYRNLALVSLAARAAVDEVFINNFFDEDVYEGDEASLKIVATWLEIAPKDFEAWRALLLTEARSIVELWPVFSAIIKIAKDLQIAKGKGRGLSSKHVRAVLRESM